MDLKIGDVARRSGLSLRTLRYYEELGLLQPERDAGGHRRYDESLVDQLYRIRLQRALGTPLSEVDPDAGDLLGLTRRHLAEVDGELADLARVRERVRSVEARLVQGERPSDGELLDLLSGMRGDEPVAIRRLTLLVYRDIEAAHRFLVEVFGLAPGPLVTGDDGVALHGEVYAGDGLIWLHRESPDFALASPATLGGSTACMAIDVVDVDSHHQRIALAGAEIVYQPTDMPYGVREYSARDSEGGLWSFMQPLGEEEAE